MMNEEGDDEEKGFNPEEDMKNMRWLVGKKVLIPGSFFQGPWAKEHANEQCLGTCKKFLKATKIMKYDQITQ